MKIYDQRYNKILYYFLKAKYFKYYYNIDRLVSSCYLLVYSLKTYENPIKYIKKYLN